MDFQLKSDFKPTGDQPRAIAKLAAGIRAGLKHQVLLGVTGSGKTFTMANVIEQLQRPVLVISHNKTLAAQLYQEYRDFFPKNAVEYFVSYYDYYQPEAYLSQTDTYIEKDAAVNEDIDKLRLAATAALMTRRDVIVVASVSCIYNLGSPQEYLRSRLELKQGMPLRREDLIKRLVQLFYQRTDYDFKRGTFRVRGETVDVYPAYLDYGVRLELTGSLLRSVGGFDPVTGQAADKEKSRAFKMSSKLGFGELSASGTIDRYTLFPAKHYIAADNRREKALEQIRRDLAKRIKELKKRGKELEAYRLEQKTNYDLEMIEQIGYCKGIENYSRYFDGRASGEPPYTLLDFFPKDYLVIVDESHMTIPQIRGMYRGDESRKQTLIDYGFRLPSAKDNRPLRFEEFLQRVGQVIYTSATPGPWEVEQSKPDGFKKASYSGIVEQLIRPTGLLDPEIEIRGTRGQIENLLDEINRRVQQGERVLVTTLTKRMAEDLAEYLGEQDIKVHYLHADVDTLDRVDILEDLRRGKYDVVVGINLLREGLDLPEVSLVAILDADKEGFLRSETSLIQTMGRAARHVRGRVIMYADGVTGSMQRAIDEVNRRRRVQENYNKRHKIEPKSIKKPIREKLIEREASGEAKGQAFKTSPKPGLKVSASPAPIVSDQPLSPQDRKALIRQLTEEMKIAAEDLEFERAASLRDEIERLEQPDSAQT